MMGPFQIMERCFACTKEEPKPARYAGGEYNEVKKDKRDVDLRFAFCFPDTYEIGMSNLGFRILYGILNEMPGRRRVRRRRGSRLPLCAFLLAVLSFTLASALPPEEPPQPAQPARTVAVRSMASLAELDAPDLSSWSLTLVNQWNPLSRDNTFTPEKLSNGLVVDQRCYPDLQAMMDACRAAGLSPVICSAYRSYEKRRLPLRRRTRRLPLWTAALLWYMQNTSP